MKFSSFLSLMKYRSVNDIVRGREYSCRVDYLNDGVVNRHDVMQFSLDGLNEFSEANGKEVSYVDRCLCLKNGALTIKVAPPFEII